MADHRLTFYSAPIRCNNKNSGIILGEIINVYFRDRTMTVNAKDSLSEWNEPYIRRENKSDVVHKKRSFRYQYLRIYHDTQSQPILNTDAHANAIFKNKLLNSANLHSLPLCYDSVDNTCIQNSRSKSWHHIETNSTKKSNVIHSISDCPNPKCVYSNTNPYSELCWQVYRCQLFKTEEESCCCSCNSDAMFEVMKSLYDCYKKKNCDNCNCILCGHLPREERRLGELRKSDVEIAAREKEKLSKKLKLKSRTSLAYEGKSAAEKEMKFKEMAMGGYPLPEGKTQSERNLITKVHQELGLPQAPTNSADYKKMNEAYKAGLITPLEGKNNDQKEKILTKQAEFGITLPNGRTSSEKALIEKVKASLSDKQARKPSEKLRKAKAERLLTPLQGKSKEQKERILKGLTKQGVPFPEAETASDQKLMDQVRAQVGLPPEPRTPSIKEKYNEAIAAGLITPLEGKSTANKEKILRKQAEIGLPLPEGRSPSEKALIAKIKDTTWTGSQLRVPSEKLRKAKEAGLLTPLKNKSNKQKEKILKGLVKQGIPLPEASTVSEQKLMDLIRAEVGLPPLPKTPSAKEKYIRAIAAGLITPLEGKSNAKKEKILQKQAKMGLPLPEGRSPSEKALIANIKETTQPEKGTHVPSEKLRKAKQAGLFTPLEGKSKQQKENIFKGLAKQGIPLPEAKTASDQKLMDKVRIELGLPPEPKTQSAKEKYDRAMTAGLITPLEGKSVAKREKVLREQAKLGLPLPEGRSPSEKALIARIKETTWLEKEIHVPSEKMRKAKAAGLLSPLEDKSKEQKEKIFKGILTQGLPLPEAKTTSDQKLMDKVRFELGLPPEPKTPSAIEKYNKAIAVGLITPLEGKSITKKEKILREQAKLGLPLPEGRSPSEKALIANIKETTQPEIGIRVPSEKLRKAKEAGLLTPLEGKSKQQKEYILKGLAKQGIPLPEAKTASDQKLMDKVRNGLGLPPEPKAPDAKEKYKKAIAAGLITPLDGKSIAKKEKILRDQAKMGIPLPEGRSASEKALIAKIKETNRPEIEVHVPSEKLRKAKAAGLLTPLKGKSKHQKEKILKGLVKQGIPLPEASTASEQKLMDQIRTEVGLPPVLKTTSAIEKYNKAMAAGLITPLEGKSIAKQEKILLEQAKLGLPLPEGRSPSEKALIDHIKKTTQPEKNIRVPSEKLRKAKATGLLTPLEGKSKQQKEKILKGLAEHGIPLPEASTASEQKLMERIRAEVGLPPVPKSPSAKEKYNRAIAAGLITPLEGKSIAKKEKILRDQVKMGLPLPEGRSPSEKSLISKIKATSQPEKKIRMPSEKFRQAKAAGLLTPLEGKSTEQKKKILKGLVKHGIQFPVASTASNQKLIDEVRAEVGLPPEPKTASDKEKYDKAMATGLITPLEGKSSFRKEEILRGQVKLGLPLPTGRTSSEKALIKKVTATVQPKVEGVQVARRPALPPDKWKKLDKTTAKILKEDRGPSDECICDLLTPESAKKRIITSKVPSEILRKAKAAGLLTPLEGKSKHQKEKILKGLAEQGMPLPEAVTASEQKLMDQIRAEVGLPPEPKTPSDIAKYHKAMAAGLITPLKGKSIANKEKILREQAKLGLPLPEGRSPSEKSLIDHIKKTTQPEKIIKVPSEKLRKAKAAGLLTPLVGKSKEQKEKILKGLAVHGIPLPDASTSSEHKLMERIRAEVGLPPVPKSPSDKVKYNKGIAAGLITPLEGKSIAKKEKILRDQVKMGLPLPEGRSPSEKSLISKIKATSKPEKKIRMPSEKFRQAKAAGLLTPLEGKSKRQKEQILKGLAEQGMPLPEAVTASEQKLMDQIRAEVGLPPEPKTPSDIAKYHKAMAAGLITPLKGKSIANKEKILREQAKLGLPLPEGRSPSEKSLIDHIKKTTQPEKIIKIPSEKLRKAKAAGLLTPLEGKFKEQKEKILKGLAVHGIPLPDANTSSEHKLMERIRAEVGLPPVPKSPSDKVKYNKGIAAGLITPLEGKSIAIKEIILRDLAKTGLPLPNGRSPSEKSLIAKIKEISQPEKEIRVPSEKLRQAKVAGLLTPLEGKSKQQKENIMKGLAKLGIPLPVAKSASDQKLMDKVRAEIGLPPEPNTLPAKEKYDRAIAAGLITPLQGKSKAKKEKILQDLAKMGLPLPEGQSPSEISLIAQIKKTTWPEKEVRVTSEKLHKAKAAGFLTPLEGKSNEQKKNILKGLVKHGIPLPEARTASDQKIKDQVRYEVGLPPEPKTASTKEMYDRAMAAGLITPLEGKSATRREEILRGQAKFGLLLPEGRTSSEKVIIEKVKAAAPPLAETSLFKPVQVAGRPSLRQEILKKLDTKTAKMMKEKKGPSDECICDLFATESEREYISPVTLLKKKFHLHKISSEKIRKAKEEGLLTPLEGKKPEEKKRILKALAMKGIPLPEAKSASEKRLIDKVHAEIGLPPKPRTSQAKILYNKAVVAGLITPLEGKSAAKREEILHAQAKMGLQLPEGRTVSEKALIAKVIQNTTKRETSLAASESPIPSEKLHNAKALGLLTPLQGKSFEKKEKVLTGLAEAGLPLPRGETPSEISLIRKVKTKYGIPIKAKTTSEKEILKKGKVKELLNPLKGKTLSQKEKILKGLAESGLPIPEGTTPSEIVLVQKVRTMAGLTPEPIFSEKRGEIKKKIKKNGSALGKVAKSVGVFKTKGGILEEFEDIAKTTMCDKGCGCDKKKIRFKHSYVKIRVTSPDISSLCPCPEECVPGVKGGVFMDNEGIKVTIGRVLAIPSFPSRELPKIKRKISDYCTSQHTYTSNTKSKQTNNSKCSLNYLCPHINGNLKFPEDDTIIFIKTFTSYLENSHLLGNENKENFYTSPATTNSSFESVYLLKTDSSISLTTASGAYSAISFSMTETSSYTDYSTPNDLLNIKFDTTEWNENCSSTFYSTSNAALATGEVCSTTSNWSSKRLSSNSVKTIDREILLLKAIQSETRLFKHLRNDRRQDPCTNFKGMKNNLKIMDTVTRVLSKRAFKDSSSLVIVMSTSSDEFSNANFDYSLDYPESIICIQVSENHSIRNYSTGQNMVEGLKLVTKAKHDSVMEVGNNNRHPNETLRVIEKQNKPGLWGQKADKTPPIISTDTSGDRPCCCVSMEANGLQKSKTMEQTVENIASEMVTRNGILQEAIAHGVSDETYTSLKNKKFVQHSQFSRNMFNRNPVRFCNLPLCEGNADSHITEKQLPIDGYPCIKSMQSCSPGKTKDLPGKAKQAVSVSSPKSKLMNPCQECSKFKDTSVKEKHIIDKSHCPCSFVRENGDTTKENSNTKKFKTRSLKDKDKNKSTICKCPKDPPPQFQFSAEDWIDESHIRKMKSDLTQTVSGFKLNKIRKSSEPEMSFEEILKFYADKSEQKYKRVEYDKNKFKHKHNDSADCECPRVDSDEPFQGIKFHIGGKGSRSKGLSGILCFQLDTSRSMF